VPRVTVTAQKTQEAREALLIDISQRERELEALRNRLKGFDAAIAAMTGCTSIPPPRRRTRRNVKGAVMDMIVEASTKGVTAYEIVDKAAADGRQLDRPSVSSLLSRLKREGVLSFDGERYHQVTGREIENSPSLKIVGGS
jgi:hypothetical protein